MAGFSSRGTFVFLCARASERPQRETPWRAVLRVCRASHCYRASHSQGARARLKFLPTRPAPLIPKPNPARRSARRPHHWELSVAPSIFPETRQCKQVSLWQFLSQSAAADSKERQCALSRETDEKYSQIFSLSRSLVIIVLPIEKETKPAISSSCPLLGACILAHLKAMFGLPGRRGRLCGPLNLALCERVVRRRGGPQVSASRAGRLAGAFGSARLRNSCATCKCDDGSSGRLRQ